MIEFGKYGLYVLSAYGVTFIILIILISLTLIDFTKTKNKLTKISKEND